MATNETIELPRTPNIKYITDKNGRGWFCSGDSRDGDFSTCTAEDDTIYDRGFGG